jgi:hypothetical protein
VEQYLPQAATAALPPLLVTLITYLVLRKAANLKQINLSFLLFLTILTRLSFLILTSLVNHPAVDGDMKLFYSYGRDFANGGYPAMEYPPGAMIFFSLGPRLNLSLAAFPALTSLVNLFADLLIVWSLFALGRLLNRKRLAGLAGLWWALFPLGLIFGLTRYEPVVAAALLLGTAWFLLGKPFLSGSVLGLGFTLKWLPVLAAPAFFLSYLKSKDFSKLFLLTFGLILTVGTIMLPFYLKQPLTFKYPYHFHRIRVTTAESIYYPLIFLLQPELRLAPTEAPWNEVARSLFGRTLTTLIQFSAVALVSLATMLSRGEKPHVKAAVLGLTAVVLFILFNRAFSPQFFVVTAAAYLAMGILTDFKKKTFVNFTALLLAASFAGYLIWPLFLRSWLIASVFFFTIQLALLAVIFHQVSAATLDRSESQPGEKPHCRQEN